MTPRNHAPERKEYTHSSFIDWLHIALAAGVIAGMFLIALFGDSLL